MTIDNGLEFHHCCIKPTIIEPGMQARDCLVPDLLKIFFSTSVCMCVCMCVCVCARAHMCMHMSALKIIHNSWHDLHPVRLVIQVLQLLYSKRS